jgi:hypothetical protein
LHSANFAEPVIASFFGIGTNIACFKVFYAIQIKYLRKNKVPFLNQDQLSLADNQLVCDADGNMFGDL